MGLTSVIVGALLLLAACVVQERRPPGWRPDAPRSPPVAPTAPPPPIVVVQPPAPPPGPPAPPPPRPACPPGVRPIGVLAILSDTVFRNGRPATNGERVCDGDTITTSAGGVGDVLPDGDRESDSVHIAEGTDPRFTWTLAGCLSVDSYRHGRIVATAQRRCMVIRTPDTLMLLLSGRVQIQVARNANTQVLPLRGSLTKLQPLSAQQVYSLAPTQLAQLAAPRAVQPRLQSLNVYTNNKLVRPAMRVPPEEIRRIDSSVLRRAVIRPAPADVIR